MIAAVVAVAVVALPAHAGATSTRATTTHWWTAAKTNAELVAVNPQFRKATPTTITHATCAGAGTRRKANHTSYFQAFRCKVRWTTTDTLFPGPQTATLWIAASPYVAGVICTSTTGLASLKAGACMHSHTAPPAPPTVGDATRDVGHALAALIGQPTWDGTLTCTGESESYTCQFVDAAHRGVATLVYQRQASKWVPFVRLVCTKDGKTGSC